jgi:AraC-like DNA-binding protein
MPFYKVYTPPSTLGKLVREFQIFRADWNTEINLPPPFITCLANTEQNLYFYVNDLTKIVPKENVEIPIPPVIITGPKYKTAGLLFGKDHLMIKVAFHPTGTYGLLGINMQQTVNTGLDEATFWGEEVNEVLALLRIASSFDLMIDIVSDFILRKFDQTCRPEEPIDEVAIQMLDPLRDHSLQQWADLACLSLRQFERNFIMRVGISPKLFIRIVRFEWAMKIKNNFPAKSWAEIAMECSYTDSSHLLKEFKEFAEFPPSRFYLSQSSGYSDLPTG